MYILFYCLFSISSNMAKQRNTHIHAKHPKGTGKEEELLRAPVQIAPLDKATEAWYVCPVHFFKCETSFLSPLSGSGQQQWRQNTPMITLGSPETVSPDGAAPGHLPSRSAACTVASMRWEASGSLCSLPLPLLSNTA